MRSQAAALFFVSTVLPLVRGLGCDGGADLNAVGERGKSALHLCADSDDAQSASKLKKLLERGAVLEKRDSVNHTAMHFASGAGGRGSIDKVKALVKAGADIKARDQWLKTPLHYASIHGKREIAAFLIESGADVNAKDNRMLLPIHFATMHATATSNAATAVLLASKGADIQHRSVQGAFVCEKMSAVECAMKAGFSTIAKEIEEAAQQHLVMNGDL